jgi:hypothetical protein
METLMATVIQQVEDVTTYPAAPAGLSTAAAALSPDMICQRIESYIAWRWTARGVTWFVEGPGEFAPTLAPATISTVDVWSSADAWETATLSPSPLGGYVLPCTGPYRFMGTVGGGTVPAVVLEAWRRLAEYMAAKPGKPGAKMERIRAGSILLEHQRSESWMALALQNSGAADLLRPYRRTSGFFVAPPGGGGSPTFYFLGF